jgi:hypothetical protein
MLELGTVFLAGELSQITSAHDHGWLGRPALAMLHVVKAR